MADDPLPSQIDLVSGILKLFGHRKAQSRHFNVIIKAADQILAEFGREDRIGKEGAGFGVWACSDDTGLSSRYLASALRGHPGEFAHPHDPDDFGRCYRMLRVCTELAPAFDKIVPTLPKPWPALGAAWKELEKLYEEEYPTGRAPKLYKRMKEICTP